jgi:hypothetical protein
MTKMEFLKRTKFLVSLNMQAVPPTPGLWVTVNRIMMAILVTAAAALGSDGQVDIVFDPWAMLPLLDL